MRRGRGAWAVAENSPGSQGEAGWCGKGERGQGVVTWRWKGLALWGIAQGIGLFKRANRRMRDVR